MKWREVFEELVIAIDAAGELQADNMRFVANPQSFSPDKAQGIEEIFVNFGSNVDQLGMSVAVAILDGAAFPDGPHHIILGAAGGQDIDVSGNHLPAIALKDMGIRVIPNAQYTVHVRAVGLTVDEGVCAIQLTFQDRAVRVPKRWKFAGIETAAVNTPVQTENIDQVAEAMSSDGSTLIDGIIKVSARQHLALGGQAGVIILSDAVTPRQEVLCGAGASELITGEGCLTPPTQEFDCQMPVLPNKLIYIESVGVGEAGTIMNGVSLGFKV